MYLVTSFTRTTGNSVGTNAISPGIFLNTIKQYRAILEYYTFFRAGLSVRVVLNGSPYTYGRMAIGFRPVGRTYDPISSSLIGAVCRPQVTSFTENTSVELEWDFQMPLDWLEVSKFYTNNDYASEAFGQLYFSDLTPLYCNNSTDSKVTINVFLAFKDPVVAGYRAAPGDQSHFVAQGRKKAAASNKHKVDPPQKARPVVKTGPASDPVQKEAKAKVAGGTLSGIARAVSGVAPMLTLVPGIGEFAAPAGMIASVLAPILEGMGLAKPRVDPITQNVNVGYWSELPQAAGADRSNRICLDPDQRLGDSVVPESGWTWRDISQLPSLTHRFTVPADAVPQTVVGSIPLNPHAWSADITEFQPWAAFAASQYKYWRGSVKLRFDFVCGKFLSSRFILRYLPIGAGTPYDENYLTHVVDVRGDTSIDIVVPYLHTRPYASHDAILGQIQIELMSTIVGGDPAIINPIEVLVWAAMAPDFQTNLFLPPGRALFEGTWDDFESDTFEPFSTQADSYVESQLVADEQVYDIVTLMKQYDRSQAEFLPGNLGVYQTKIRNCFLWWRGSTRFQTFPTTTTITRLGLTPFNTPYPPMWAHADNSLCSNFEYPFYQSIPYCVTYDVSYLQMTFQSYSEPYMPTHQAYTAVGEDYELGWLISPPHSPPENHSNAASSVSTVRRNPSRRPVPVFHKNDLPVDPNEPS